MATYAIGDIHGSYETLRRLLARIEYDPACDRLWLVGDLVNRGPRSLAVLRWAISQGDRVVAVLGNHDLHLLARAAGLAEPKRRDTLDDILEAQDRDDLLGWLRSRPLIHRENGFLMVHAGLFPEWTAGQAERLAREVETALRSEEADRLLQVFGRKSPDKWKDSLTGLDRVRTALAGFAKLRTIRRDGHMCADYSGPPEQAPKGCLPWFAIPGRRSADHTVIFGHWAALGLKLDFGAGGVAGLDTGCAWGRWLTALRLEDLSLVQEPAAD
jgi:bis(5'-nucleosyl)-tetraphosphatase (symmetrical)